MPLTARPIVTDHDYRTALDLLGQVVAAGYPRANLNQAEFEYEWHAYYAPEEQRLSALWFNDALPVGCLLCTGRTALVAALPGSEEIEDALYAWAEERLPADQPAFAMAFDADARRAALLRRRGYVRTAGGMNIRARSIDAPPPQPDLPPGYRLRSLDEADIPARAALYGRAFTDDDLLPERLRAITRSVTYRGDLDLVATAPDGSLAAFATVWYDPANRLGVFEPVGCDPPHLRRGLARALMHEGLRRLHALGAQAAQVSVGVQRGPANQLYQVTSFALIDRQAAWKKAR